MAEMLEVFGDLCRVPAKFENPALATKNSGLVTVIATTLLCVDISNGYFLTHNVLLENHIERSLLLKHST